MFKSVASDCNKRGQTVLHFVNATPKVAKSIAWTLPSADIAFLPKVRDTEFDPLENTTCTQVQIVVYNYTFGKVSKDDDSPSTQEIMAF